MSHECVCVWGGGGGAWKSQIQIFRYTNVKEDFHLFV